MKEPSSEAPVFRDSLSRHLYANDASIYEELPQGVCFPRSRQDIQQAVEWAQQNQLSITARAGGTSLAGQATGNGLIMDVSRYMDRILGVDFESSEAHVQPGVIRDSLNRHAAKGQLQFGPDTSTTNRCAMGGMIGNNSSGSFSIKHKTTREHILEIEAVLSDGSVAHFKPLDQQQLDQKLKAHTLEGHIYRGMMKLLHQNYKLIKEAYPHPEIIRRNTGYALDRLIEMSPLNPEGRRFNLAELLCGSEGTLALTASARLRLVPQEQEKVLIVPQFETLDEATRAAVRAVEYNPSAVELIDHVVLDATKRNREQYKNRFFLEGEPNYLLIIQFDGDRQDELCQRARQLAGDLGKHRLGYAAPVFTASHDISRVWNLRKAGLGLLMGLGEKSKSPSFVEDTAVRVQDLPDYTREFQQLLDKYDTDCVFYGHASVGELHLRPMINIKEVAGQKKMEAMAEDVAELVHRYGGSLSGEHGDGRVRAPYIPYVLGEQMMPVLRKVKELWDPNYVLNPGKIVDPKPINTDLRLPAVSTTAHEAIPTAYNWREEGSFQDALELCNGAGVCRKLAESGGTMCPSYMATRDEKDSTRGRANLFRQLFAGKGMEAFASEELKSALDLCLSCKACKTECPANVDMAKMKGEFLEGWHSKHGITLSERFFGFSGKIYPLAQKMAGLVNRFNKTPVAKELMYQLFNIHPARSLPQFARQSFFDWYNQQRNDQARAPGHAESKGTILLHVDLFTNYHEPHIAQKALALLERLGYQVELAPFMETGRPQLSKGFVQNAKELAERQIDLVEPYVTGNIPIVGLEPSEILTLRDEYTDLCRNDQVPLANTLASRSYMIEEFILEALQNSPDMKAVFAAKGRPVYIHGHCHAKALAGMEPLIEIFRLAGFEAHDMQTGCCGMAGSFGYEADKYKLSLDIGELQLFPKVRAQNNNEQICAPGFSCRHQIADGTGVRALHPVELLYQVMV